LNWKQGATSIEADAIAEGFKRSIEIHGIKYSKMIGFNKLKIYLVSTVS